MGYLVTVVSKIYSSIVTNFNVNFKTTSGNETNAVDKTHISTYGWAKKSLKLVQPKSIGYVIRPISQIYKSIVTNFNTNSSTATGNESEAIEKSPYFYFRLDENLAQSCTTNYNGI